MTHLRLALALATAAALALPASAPAAELLYGVTAENRLVRFASDDPASAGPGVPIRGLEERERVLGIDVRPLTGQLVGVTSTGRLAALSPDTGSARPIQKVSPGFNGSRFGFDAEPFVDAVRMTSDDEESQRFVLTTNQYTTEDPLRYRDGDPGAGADPAIAGSASAIGFSGGVRTALYSIDVARDALVVQGPNTGLLTTVGPLGTDVGGELGFDIAGTGVGYAAVARGEEPSELVRIDLRTGRATPAARRPLIAAASASAADPGFARIVSLSAAGTVPDDRRAPALSVAFSSTVLEQNTDTLAPSVACDESCAVQVAATVDGRAAGTGTASIVGGAGRATVRVPLDAAARRRIRRAGTELIRLTVVADDAAGNAVTQRRVSRTQTLAGRRGG